MSLWLRPLSYWIVQNDEVLVKTANICHTKKGRDIVFDWFFQFGINLKPSETIWNHLKQSETIWNNLNSAETIWTFYDRYLKFRNLDNNEPIVERNKSIVA